jgi:signal transduction histidine kinase
MSASRLEEDAMSAAVPLDSLGRRRSPAAVPGYLAGRPPRSKGRRYPADPPRTEEIIAVMRCCCERPHGLRARGLIVPDALVSEAGDPAMAFRDALSKVLGDPLLSVDFLTGTPAAAPGRELTMIVDGSAVVAALVHRVGALRDPVLHEAVTGAARLQAANLTLQRELQAQGDALAASGRRLLAAADEQRHRLERRVRAGPVARLEALERRLATTDGLDDARRNLATSLEELRTLAAGLYPGVADGTPLVAALTALAARTPMPTRVEAKRLPEIPAAVRSALLFTCGEALANVVKHAAATRAEIDVRAVGAAIELTITDDGRGGADPAAGSGLRGLQDRIGLLGGTLSATAGDGGGTRVAVRVPLGDAR